jgi:hypothetical protein
MKNITIIKLTLLLRILEVSRSNLSLRLAILMEVFDGFPQSL